MTNWGLWGQMNRFLLSELEARGIIQLGRGKIISKLDMGAHPGSYPVYSSSATGNGLFGSYGDYMFDDARITWSIDGGGRFFYRPEHKYSVTNVCGWIKVLKPELLDTKYLYYCLFAQWLHLTFDYTYKAHPSVIRGKYVVELRPLEIQQVIVSNLDSITALIEKGNEKKPLFDELVKARFVEMFGDPVQNEKGYEVIPLGELGKLKRGTSKHRPRNDAILLGGPYPLIQTGDVSNADTFITKYTSTYSEAGLKQSKMWDKGTLCITIAANIAETAILGLDACFPDSVVGFKPYDQVTTLFIHNWFKFLQPILEENAPSVAQKNLNVDTLEKVEVIVPPMDDQLKYEEMLKQIDKSKFVEGLRLAKRKNE